MTDIKVSDIKVGQLVRATRVVEYEGRVTKATEQCVVLSDGINHRLYRHHWTFEALPEPVETFGPGDVVQRDGCTFHLYKNGYEINGSVYLYGDLIAADQFTSANGFEILWSLES